MDNGFNDQALDFFEVRAINPGVAAELGVVQHGDELVFPGDRRRDLNGSGSAKVRQPKGRRLDLWWLGEPSSTALLTEGETDALAAYCALRHAPGAADLGEITVASIPGAGFPPKRLAELAEQGVTEVFLAIDNDDAGRSFTSKAAKVLSDAGLTPIVVELPEGRDVADVLAEPDDPGDLLANLLVEAQVVAEEPQELVAAPPRQEWAKRQPLDLRMADEPEPPDLLVAGLERGTVVALCADTGGAKSFTAQALVVGVAENHDQWIGKKLDCLHGHAILIDEENPERVLRSRLRALGLTPKRECYVRCYHRLGVRFGADGSHWTEWLCCKLEEQPADLVVIDTGIAATAPEVNDNDAVVRLYTDHLRPLAAETGTVIVILLHEKKPQEGARLKQTFATMGARAWIQQADTQLMLAKRGKSEEEEDGDGIRLVSRFALATGKLRDGGAEIVEGLEIRSRLRGDRALLEAEIVNEGPIEADPKTYDMLDRIEEVLTEAGAVVQKKNIAEKLGVEPEDRTFERALGIGIGDERLEKPKRGFYELSNSPEIPIQEGLI